jgi:hypothetical protein
LYKAAAQFAIGSFAETVGLLIVAQMLMVTDV